eukprot:Lithocolla_globosa_v1_NODE_2567_length_1950_cov_17.572559.p4 type:complete len:152 gc:universal NODE_2567_length_1950_cov_17.572559:776-1231(+)
MYLRVLDDDELVVGDALLEDLLCVAQRSDIKALLALQIRQGGHQGGPGGTRNPLEIRLGTPPHSKAPSVNKELESQVVNALGCEDDVCARGEDFLDLLASDVCLAPFDRLDLVGVRHHHTHPKSHLGTLQVHVETSNLGPDNALLHRLSSH